MYAVLEHTVRSTGDKGMGSSGLCFLEPKMTETFSVTEGHHGVTPNGCRFDFSSTD